MNFRTFIRLLLISLLLAGFLISCTTLPDYEMTAYCLPLDGDRVLSIHGKESRLFLEPMATALGIDDFEKIEPLLDQTDRIYLVSRGNELFIQGQGEYSRGMINFFLGTNRDWSKRKIGPFVTYESKSTALQIIFPDSHFFFLSMGNLSEILSSYQMGGSPEYPFEKSLEEQESLLIRVDLKKGAFLSMQNIIKTPLTMVEIALSPSEEDNFLMDMTLMGESGKGKVLGTALKIFLLSSVGRNVIKAEMNTGDDFARMADIDVTLDFLLGMMDLQGERQ